MNIFSKSDIIYFRKVWLSFQKIIRFYADFF